MWAWKAGAKKLKVKETIDHLETPKVVVELLRFTGTGNCYNAQQGGNAGNGNDNGCN